MASLRVGQPTNRADRSTFVRFLVKVVCADRAGFGIRYIDEPIEVDLECAVVHLARAVYMIAPRRSGPTCVRLAYPPSGASMI